MNNTHRALLPAATAGLVFLFSGSAAYLYSTIQPIPQAQDTVYSVFHADAPPAHTEIEKNDGTDTGPSSMAQLPETGYLVKLKENALYVYAEGNREPDAVYELPADWLPDYDRTLLEYGFRVSDKAELREIIEDYIS